MGLDMHLTGDFYVQDWEHNFADGVIPPDTRAKKCQRVVGSKYPVHSVSVDLAYWRKANAIHNWFVQNVQGGKDECQTSYVSREDLQRLVDVCDAVLLDNSKASKLLPCVGGFFFGDTTYDDWYFQNVEYTANTLKEILAANEKFTIYYRASW